MPISLKGWKHATGAICFLPAMTALASPCQFNCPPEPSALRSVEFAPAGGGALVLDEGARVPVTFFITADMKRLRPRKGGGLNEQDDEVRQIEIAIPAPASPSLALGVQYVVDSRYPWFSLCENQGGDLERDVSAIALPRVALTSNSILPVTLMIETPYLQDSGTDCVREVHYTFDVSGVGKEGRGQNTQPAPPLIVRNSSASSCNAVVTANVPPEAIGKTFNMPYRPHHANCASSRFPFIIAH